MHTISVYEAGDEFTWFCTCGAQGNRYGNEAVARDSGNVHKRSAEGDPDRDKDRPQSTLPRMGY
jgi:hypothetical protein